MGHSNGPSRLSLQQQQLWFLDALEPGGCHYNIMRTFRLFGPLDIVALQHAFAQVALRHHVLRSRFLSTGGEARTVVHPPSDSQLRQVDLRGTPASELDAKVSHLCRVEAQRPFALETDEMLRGVLIRTALREHVLLVSIHHIGWDGSSMRVLLNELSICYECFRQGRLPSLPPLEIQYADYAEWQRNRVQNGTPAQHLSYWRQTLDGAPVDLPICTDFPRPDHPRHAGARRSLQLSPEISAQIKALASANRVSRFTTLLAAFKVLLGRYSGQEDIVIGSPFANRNHRQTKDLIGLFANVVVLRTDLSGDPTFSQLVGRVADVVEGAKTHQELPLAILVEQLEPPRSPGRMPWVQVEFVQAFASAETITLPGLSSKTLPIDNGTSRFDLQLTVRYDSQQLELRLVFDTDLFHPSTADRMLEHYLVLLHEIIRDPDQPISRIPLLSEAERHQSLEWNDTAVEYPRDQRVHELFEQQVERTPDAVAVVFEDQQLTYRDLNERASRLADHLRGLGVGPETLVALFMDRSAELVVGSLGILKSGGAYVPLDPETPDQRIRTVFNGTRILLAVTQEPMVGRLWECGDLSPLSFSEQESTDGIVVCGVGQGPNGKAATSHVTGERTPGDVAYVIYTSGSTGQPKGVAIEHRHLVNYTRGILDRIEFERGWHFAHVSTIAADLGNAMIFAALATGGCLHVIAKECCVDPVSFAEYFARHPIDCLKIGPSHLAALLDSPDRAQMMPRRRLILGGEASRNDWIKEIRKLAPDCRIFNHYGPTEATVGVLVYEVDGPPVDTLTGTLPLGRPLPNSRIYILDQNMQPVPIGVPGELCIAGWGVARGYLNQPELTDERFVPDPFSGGRGDQIYKTGDLARALPDGNIEFLGRNDHQVKIRGYRVELAEIESAIREHSGVRAVVVLAGEANRLTAYAEPHQRVAAPLEKSTRRLPADLLVAHPSKTEQVKGTPRRYTDATSGSLNYSTDSHLREVPFIEDAVPTPRELRQLLARRLPNYMVPSSFVMLDALPLTPNGKIDRSALLGLDDSLPELERDYVAPRKPKPRATEQHRSTWAYQQS